MTWSVYVSAGHCYDLAAARFCIRSTWRFVIWCFVGALASRVVVSTFRAWAMKVGDYPEAEPRSPWKTFCPAFLVCLGGFSSDKRHRDLWLSFFIGFVELLVYPVLLKLGYFLPIGAWLALKTSGQWSGWRVSRTSFNRFLLNNLLHMGYAFLWLSHFVEKADPASIPGLH